MLSPLNGYSTLPSKQCLQGVLLWFHWWVNQDLAFSSQSLRKYHVQGHMVKVKVSDRAGLWTSSFKNCLIPESVQLKITHTVPHNAGRIDSFFSFVQKALCSHRWSSTGPRVRWLAICPWVPAGGQGLLYFYILRTKNWPS